MALNVFTPSFLEEPVPFVYMTASSPSTEQPTLYVARHDINHILGLALAAGKMEVCGFGFVRLLDKWSLQLISGSVFITDQLVNSGFSSPGPVGVAEAMKKERQFDEDNVFRLVWHSHTTGVAAFSSTDIRTHEDTGAGSAYEASVFMVVNQFGDATTYLEVYRPFRLTVPLRTVICDEIANESLDTHRAAVGAKCTYLPPKKGPQLLIGDDELVAATS